MTRISSKIGLIEPSATFVVFEKAHALRSRGVKVLDLGGGEPEFATPYAVCSAATEALSSGWTHYSPSRGDPDLLKAISHKLASENSLDADPTTDIISTPSAKHALFLAFSAVAGPGDEVLIPTPSWVSYKAMVQLAGSLPVEVPLSGSNNFSLTEKILLSYITPRTKAIVINSPNNPTGHMLDEIEIGVLANVASKYDLTIISDEIYEKIVYGNKRHLSIGAHPLASNRTLTVNGFSKAYAMTGWRLGWISGPADLISAALTIHQHTVGCTSAFIQRAGIAALAMPPKVIHDMVNQYKERRDLISGDLDVVPGIRCLIPDGAFYAFVNISELGRGTGQDVANWLLETKGVVVTAGDAFGSGGSDYIRLSFAGPTYVIKEAVERIRVAAAGQNN